MGQRHRWDRSDIQPAIFAFGGLKKLIQITSKASGRAGGQADGLTSCLAFRFCFFFFSRGVSAWEKQENLEIRFFNILCSHHSSLWP